MNKFYNTINYHGFKGETPVALNRFGELAKTSDYIEWFDEFPLEELADKRDWKEVAGVDFGGYFGVEIHFTATEDAKAVNMMQGLTQLLKDMYNIPQGTLVEVRYTALKRCEFESDGKIKYSLYNVDMKGENLYE
jgi:hypothetical protein